MAVYTVFLRSVGNPDFAQYAPVSEPRKVVAHKLSEIRDAIKSYIDEWDLGGGNFPSCPVRRNGKVVGHFSYNRRFWRTRRVPAADLPPCPRPMPPLEALPLMFCDDPLETLPLEDCRDRLRRVREILWPEAEPDEPWSPDHLDIIGDILEDLRLPTVLCKFCGREALVTQALLHQGGWVGPCCWDERLRTTE